MAIPTLKPERHAQAITWGRELLKERLVEYGKLSHTLVVRLEQTASRTGNMEGPQLPWFDAISKVDLSLTASLNAMATEISMLRQFLEQLGVPPAELLD